MNTVTPSAVRNIQQSLQDRDVVKLCPDAIVFINGQNYLINPYLGDGSGVPVAFNDYVTSFQASYDIDALIPTATLTLSVPNTEDHLFRAPGGNNLLRSMDEIRVFAKGYYLSPRGNTVYRQIYRGFISSVHYTVDGKLTTINISCFGALGLLERMQIDINPALQSSAAQEVVPFTSTAFNLNPYDQLALVFMYSSMLDGFEQFSLQQATMNSTNPYYNAIESGYVARWQALLFDIARDVHIYGQPSVTNVINTLQQTLKKSQAAGSPMAKSTAADARNPAGTESEPTSQANDQTFYNQIRYYMPDMSFSAIQLLNGQLTSRLERLRHLTQLIGFEAYQDIDGGIVIKPPLFNLDVTNVDNPNAPQLDNTLLDIYEQNNPFVVQLSEISAESESEDEAGVRATRLLMRGSPMPGFQLQGTEWWQTTAEDLDVVKMCQFGLRTEAPHSAPWFRDGDVKGLQAYASTELARMNRGFRTYNITIPLRPELKLGFPMFLPWRDLYGYIKSVVVNYTVGGEATMSITLDCLRRRPMYPVQQQVPNASGTAVSLRTLFTPQENLVLQWTAAPASVTNNPVAQLVGQLATLPLPNQTVLTQEKQMEYYRTRKIGNSWGPAMDTTTHCWRVQPDTAGKFTQRRLIDPTYYEDLRTIRPYTDGKGYELIGTWPWGRFDSLKNALYQFTIADTLAVAAAENPGGNASASIQPVSGDTVTLSDAKAFLFMGLGTPSSTPEAASDLLTALEGQSTAVSNYKVFELTYDSTNTPSTLNGILGVNNPGTAVIDGAMSAEANVQARTSAFLTGAVPPSPVVESILYSVTETNSQGAAITTETNQ